VRRIDLDGRSPADVAAELGRTVGDIYTIRSRAFRKLRDRLDGRSTVFWNSL
jgi:DNA-directed RNA polymerase specialized sigma24 family protein